LDLKTSAQTPPPAKIPRIGFLSSTSAPTPTAPAPFFQSFRKGLDHIGYSEGRTIIIEPRFSEGWAERLPELAADLARLRVDVVSVIGAVTARAAKNVTTSIPIVFAVVVDPVADGVVASIERPGRNVTGITTFDPGQARKQLELLKEAIPGLARVAILADQGVSEALTIANEEQARALGLQPQRLVVAGPTPDLDGAFTAARRDRADALLVLEEPITVVYRKRIAELAAKDRLPTLFARDWVDAGGLIAYGTSLNEAVRRMPAYVDKILKGAKPSDLPVEVITRHELIINLKTAREIGVTIPPEVLKRADQIIQ